MLSDVQNDLLILGGGCAGLSLARRLSILGKLCPQTLILESRSAYLDDRTWCFWNEPSAQLTHLVSHRWLRVSVAAKENSATVDCHAYPYSMIPSAAFYDESISMLGQTDSIQLELGVSVLSEPKKIGNVWYVETSAGMRSARKIVDTRPTDRPQRGKALLWQSFVGHEIDCSEPVFQPDIAEIMHFEPVCDGRILFFYLLPFSKNRALLEATIFAPEPYGPDKFQNEMEAFIARRVKGYNYTFRRSEHGILPMGMPPSQTDPDPSYVKAGLFSGGARPSSGYAFQRIQRWASLCAEALGQGQLPLPHAPDPILLRKMDSLFLKVLRRQPEIAPELFMALFRKTNIGRLVRFMSDRASVVDYLAISLALPSKPFLQQIYRAFAPSHNE